MPKNVEQVPVKKRNELGRHGHHERDDKWTWHISRAEKEVSVTQYYMEIMTMHKMVVLDGFKVRQVIRK